MHAHADTHACARTHADTHARAQADLERDHELLSVEGLNSSRCTAGCAGCSAAASAARPSRCAARAAAWRASSSGCQPGPHTESCSAATAEACEAGRGGAGREAWKDMRHGAWGGEEGGVVQEGQVATEVTSSCAAAAAIVCSKVRGGTTTVNDGDVARGGDGRRSRFQTSTAGSEPEACCTSSFTVCSKSYTPPQARFRRRGTHHNGAATGGTCGPHAPPRFRPARQPTAQRGLARGVDEDDAQAGLSQCRGGRKDGGVALSTTSVGVFVEARFMVGWLVIHGRASDDGGEWGKEQKKGARG